MKKFLITLFLVSSIWNPWKTAKAQPCCHHYQVTDISPYSYRHVEISYQPFPRHIIQGRSFLPPPRWSIGLHLTGISTNQSLSNDPVLLGGLGGHLRYRGYWWGAELTVDAMGNSFVNGNVDRISVPIQLSALFYLVPHGRFNLFLLAGPRVVATEMIYNMPNLYTRQSFAEFGFQGGLGAELILSRHFSLTADVRGFAVFRHDEGPSGQYYQNIENAVLSAQTVGVQANFGASVRF